jgi:hypothetical protein
MRKTPAHMSRLLLARLRRWFPERHFIFVGDSGDGTRETARFCQPYHRHLTLVSTCSGDAAWYEPPPPRTRRTMGRPRVKGQKLASPPEMVAHTDKRTRLMVAWGGGSTRDIEIVTGTGPWYRLGEALAEVPWFSVHDGTGPHRDEYVLTTDITMKPQQLGECDTQCWSIATTCQEGRESLKLASTKSDGQQTVRRFTPCVFGLYTGVVLLYRQLPCSSSTRRAVCWRGKSPVTCSAMMTCVCRAFWAQWCVHTQAESQECSTLSPSLQETILYAVAPAA